MSGEVGGLGLIAFLLLRQTTTFFHITEENPHILVRQGVNVNNFLYYMGISMGIFEKQKRLLVENQLVAASKRCPR